MFDFQALAQAVVGVFSPMHLLYIGAGVLLGTLGGILPGINAAIGISLILPFTYSMQPLSALLLILGMWGGQNYGSGVTATLIRTPGAPASAATIFDGYPLHQQGKSGKALGIQCIASASGWFISTLFLIALSLPLARVALSFGPAEYFAVGLFGLSMISSMSAKNVLKGFISATVGLLLATIGVDPFAGTPRFTLGRVELLQGVELLVVMLGLFALSEVLSQSRKLPGDEEIHSRRQDAALPTWQEVKYCLPAILRNSVLGTFVGVAPGAGGSIAGFIAYDSEKRFSKHPERFGKGAMDGVAAVESANNATEGGALVPLLTLGVPGTPAAAVVLAALIIYGVRPSPQVFSRDPVFIYSIFIGLMVGAVFLLGAGLFLTKYLVFAIRVKRPYLLTAITGLVFMGANALSNDAFTLKLLVLFGVIGYVMRRFGFPVAPLVLSMVLGFMIETSLRRALIISEGSWSVFFTRPISALVLLLAFVSFVYPFYQEYRQRKVQESGASKSV